MDWDNRVQHVATELKFTKILVTVDIICHKPTKQTQHIFAHNPLHVERKWAIKIIGKTKKAEYTIY